jgi:hypothetical protein
MIHNYRAAEPSHRHRLPSPTNPLKYKDNDRVTVCDGLLLEYGDMGFYRLYRKLATHIVTPSHAASLYSYINGLGCDDRPSPVNDDVTIPLIPFVEVHHG